jgi:hypothetical protein
LTVSRKRENSQKPIKNMADKEKIKRILRSSVTHGKIITEAQISEIADKIIRARQVDEELIENFSNAVVKDPDALSLNAIDMSDVNDELKK